MIRNAADLEELIQNSLDNPNSAPDKTILPKVEKYFEQGGAASVLVNVLKSKMTCPVCKEIPVEGCQLSNCKHVFCSSCLKLWFLTKENCPLCRSEWTNNWLRPLTVMDTVVKNIMYTHDPDFWEKRQEEENAKSHSLFTKHSMEHMPSQMKDLEVRAQMLQNNDVLRDAEGAVNIREHILKLIEDYDNCLKSFPMTDENELELLASTQDLMLRYHDALSFFDDFVTRF